MVQIGSHAIYSNSYSLLDHNNVVRSRAQSWNVVSIKIGELRLLRVLLRDVHGSVVLRDTNAACGVEVDNTAIGGAVDVLSARGGMLVAGGVVEHRLRRKAGIVFLDVGRLVVGHGWETVGLSLIHI